MLKKGKDRKGLGLFTFSQQGSEIFSSPLVNCGQ